ncbi:tetracycline efflux protein [Ophiostoma piceae UAMH 11346]|uniref:Tetracycline efflux protein n=1 Tax=Ophiostoma piceae (strain UAMH 11346) TaxID=1262450 RepID=S3C5I1_OPHP1|nr:tetracycline efflux protein [Ophiostoma piceae UAMH 11346]
MMSFFRVRQKDKSPSASSSSLSASSAASSPRNQPCTLHTPTETLLITTSNMDSSQDTGKDARQNTGNSEPKPVSEQHMSELEADATPPSCTSIQAKTATATTASEANAATSTSATTLVDDKGRCLACRQEKLEARRYRWKVIIGLIFPFALQALDVTIIASALPWIATDFGEVSQLNWIISSFNLTSAAFIPFWGQVADIFGRHPAIQTALVIMMIGSAICTAAPTTAFPVLLLGRGIQGLGCAGLNVVVRVILLDRVSLKENAKNWSIFSFTAGMSYGIGPVIGGALTNVNWRWCFAINLPICVAALVLIYFVLRPELLSAQPVAGRDQSRDISHADPSNQTSPTLVQRIATIDAGGQALFLSGFGLLILALTWAGATYDWTTAAVLVPLFLGLLLIAAFVVYEHHMTPPDGVIARMWPRQKAMLPWKLLESKDIGLMFYINFATGAAMYSVLYFCNLYFTMVKVYGPTYAGTQLLYYTPGLGIGVYLSMYLLNGRPCNTFAPLMLGSVIEAVGVGALAWALWSEHLPAIICMMALTGAGTGLRLMPGSLHAVGFFPQHIATVVAIMAVAVPLGGTLALTVMSTVFNNTSGIASTSPLRSVTTLNYLPPNELATVEHNAKCVVCALFLGNVRITTDAKSAETGETQAAAENAGTAANMRRANGARASQAGDMQDTGDPGRRLGRQHVVSDIYLATLLRSKRRAP